MGGEKIVQGFGGKARSPRRTSEDGIRMDLTENGLGGGGGALDSTGSG
jgi:hypothetical protein